MGALQVGTVHEGNSQRSADPYIRNNSKILIMSPDVAAIARVLKTQLIPSLHMFQKLHIRRHAVFAIRVRTCLASKREADGPTRAQTRDAALVVWTTPLARRHLAQGTALQVVGGRAVLAEQQVPKVEAHLTVILIDKCL